MHRILDEKKTLVCPRSEPDIPAVGIFAARAPIRPNPIGLTLVELMRREGNVLIVKGLDALDGTPVLDIKPYFLLGERPLDRGHGLQSPLPISTESTSRNVAHAEPCLMTEGKIECKHLRSDNLCSAVLENDEAKLARKANCENTNEAACCCLCDFQKMCDISSNYLDETQGTFGHESARACVNSCLLFVCNHRQCRRNALQFSYLVVDFFDLIHRISFSFYDYVVDAVESVGFLNSI